MRCAIYFVLIAGLSATSALARVIDEQPKPATGPATQTVLSPAVPTGIPLPGGLGTTRPTTQATTQNAGRIRFPTWGIDLVPPAGWTRMPESDFTVMAQWTPSDGSQGVFRILVTPMLNRSVTKVADSIAQGLQGNVVETTLDGRIAKRIVGGADGTSEIVCQREGYLVEIRCHHATSKVDELEAIRKTWRWIDIESPAKRPELRPDWIPLSDQVVVQMPSSFRAWPIPPAPPGTVRYAACDLMRQRIRREFDVEFSMPPDMQGQPLDKLATKLSQPYQLEMAMKRPIGWRLIEGMDDRVISQQILGPRPPDKPDAPPKYAKCIGIVALDNRTRLLAVFTCVSDNDDERFAYINMAESIVATIRVGVPKPAPATAPAAAAPNPRR